MQIETFLAVCLENLPDDYLRSEDDLLSNRATASDCGSVGALVILVWYGAQSNCVVGRLAW